jgi:hypothetical protein
LVGLVIALRPQTPKHIRGGWSHYTDTSEPVDGGVGTLQLWTTRTILMDRENSLTLLWPKWGSNPMPSDPQSELLIDCATGSGSQERRNVLISHAEKRQYLLSVTRGDYNRTWFVGPWTKNSHSNSN